MDIDKVVQVVQVAYPQVYHACHTRHQRKRTSVHRVSARDSTILAHLNTTSATVPARLAEHLGIARSTLSEALKRLAALGYVEPPTSKSGGVRLSAKGLEVIRRNSVLEERRLEEVLRTLTPAERRAVVAGMQALADGCQRMTSRRANRGNGAESVDSE